MRASRVYKLHAGECACHAAGADRHQLVEDRRSHVLLPCLHTIVDNIAIRDLNRSIALHSTLPLSSNTMKKYQSIRSKIKTKLPTANSKELVKFRSNAMSLLRTALGAASIAAGSASIPGLQPAIQGLTVLLDIFEVLLYSVPVDADLTNDTTENGSELRGRRSTCKTP